MLKKKNRKGEEIILRLSSLLQNQKKLHVKPSFFSVLDFIFFLFGFFFPSLFLKYWQKSQNQSN